MHQPAPTKLTDSPWFWAYVFSAAAVVALLLAGPKYLPRQTQLERRFLARQAGGQTVKGHDGSTIDPPTEENLMLQLGPLFIICGCLLLVAWSRLWMTRFVRRQSHLDAAMEASARDQEQDPN